MKKESNPEPPFASNHVFITEKEVARVFTEWDRRYREEPERFMSEAEVLLKETPETYGDACAPYFLKILNEIKKPSWTEKNNT